MGVDEIDPVKENMSQILTCQILKKLKFSREVYPVIYSILPYKNHIHTSDLSGRETPNSQSPSSLFMNQNFILCLFKEPNFKMVEPILLLDTDNQSIWFSKWKKITSNKIWSSGYWSVIELR